MERIVHKKVAFEYELLDRFEAGIELFGHEVKSARSGRISFEGSHIVVRGGEAYLVGATIQPYQPSNTPEDYDPVRPRKLLLTKKELIELGAVESKQGLTIVPVVMYNKNGKLKLEIAIARGKKQRDKRETIKKRESKIEIERHLKGKR